MTRALQKEFNTVSNLSEVEQDAIAAWLQEELEAESKWSASLSKSSSLLQQLAGEACA